ncbi:MAG: sugar ABC transporter permease [Lachnospiraceae bacterium]|nr:sugar ABC transporter permease [Lachnospiraceae bacterium]
MNYTRSMRIKAFGENMWKNKALLLLILPGFVLIVLFSYIPMGGLVLAFKEFNYTKGIWKSDWVGFDNIKFLFMSGDTAWRMIRNTIGYYVLFRVVGTIANVSLAIALNECRHKYFAKFSQTIMIMPTFISFIAISFIVSGLLADNGYVNNILQSLGFEKIQFYIEPKYWPAILTLVHVWKETGYGSVIYLSALAGMDQEMFEAADIDGANRWQKIRYLTLPMLSSTIAIMTLLSLGNMMHSSTGLFYQVTRNIGALYPATQTLDTYVLNALSEGGSTFGITAGVTFIQSVVGCFMTVVVNLIVRKISPEHSLF